MSFKKFLSEQLKAHPCMQMQDILKLCYQAAYGPEHILHDTAKAEKHLEDEFYRTEPSDKALFEQISDDYVRVDLGAWKHRKLPLKWLFNVFRASAATTPESDALFERFISVCRDELVPESWDNFISEYKKQGMGPVHHSDIYRAKEAPSYRVVKLCYTRIFPVLEAALNCASKPCVIVIDGRAASGKSTLAGDLSLILGADLVHMDDFYLPIELKTGARLNEAGGNIHYERFCEEVLPFISQPEAFSYRVFSCSKMNYSGSVTVKSVDYRIIEGSYSMHPIFGNYGDIHVFSSVDSETQMARILHRNGAELAHSFAGQWIPMEEKYFESFNIEQRCEIFV